MIVSDIISKLQEKNIKLRLIVAPPRTASTMLQVAMSKNSGVATYIHEPFVRPEEKGFNAILQAIEDAPPNTTLLIKDMSHWLATDEQFKELFSIVSEPIVFLIRNPILSLASRIHRNLEKYYLVKNENVFKFLLSFFGEETGNLDLNVENQQMLLNRFARHYQNEGWVQLTEAMKVGQDFSPVFELLEQCFPYDKSGFKELIQEFSVARGQGIKYIIVDSSELRMFPKEILGEICNDWNLTYEPEMANWETKQEGLKTNGTGEGHMVWFDHISKSTGIEPPREPVFPFEAFPPTFANYLNNVDLRVYKYLATNPECIRGESNAQIPTEGDKYFLRARREYFEQHPVLGRRI